MNGILRFLTDARKAVAAAAVGVAGLAGQVVALGVLHGTALHYAQVILAGATAVSAALSVYHASNGDTAGTVPAFEPPTESAQP